MKLMQLLFLFLFLTACKKNDAFEVKSFKVKKGWGYAISMNEKTIIKQTVIPAVSDKRSFVTEADALKTGNLVLERIKHGLSPSVSKKDLFLLEISL